MTNMLPRLAPKCDPPCGRQVAPDPIQGLLPLNLSLAAPKGSGHPEEKCRKPHPVEGGRRPLFMDGLVGAGEAAGAVKHS